MADIWGKTYHRKLSQGWDNGSAAFAADQAEKYHKRKQRQHETSFDCWCHPELDYVDPETGNEVWVHREIQ